MFSSTEAKTLPTEKKCEQIREEIVKMIVEMNPQLKSKLKEETKMLINLANQILKDNKKFTGYFEQREFEKMAKLYEQRGSILITPEYERLYGKASALYWSKTWKPETTLKFKTVHIYLNNSINHKEKEKFDFIASVVNEIHFIHFDKRGRILNETSIETRVYRHRFDCWWEY